MNEKGFTNLGSSLGFFRPITNTNVETLDNAFESTPVEYGQQDVNGDVLRGPLTADGTISVTFNSTLSREQIEAFMGPFRWKYGRMYKRTDRGLYALGPCRYRTENGIFYVERIEEPTDERSAADEG